MIRLLSFIIYDICDS